jgi:hypothetical protein
MAACQLLNADGDSCTVLKVHLALRMTYDCSQVSWSFGLKQRALLNVANLRQTWQEQQLQVRGKLEGSLGSNLKCRTAT